MQVGAGFQDPAESLLCAESVAEDLDVDLDRDEAGVVSSLGGVVDGSAADCVAVGRALRVVAKVDRGCEDTVLVGVLLDHLVSARVGAEPGAVRLKALKAEDLFRSVLRTKQVGGSEALRVGAGQDRKIDGELFGLLGLAKAAQLADLLLVLATEKTISPFGINVQPGLVGKVGLQGSPWIKSRDRVEGPVGAGLGRRSSPGRDDGNWPAFRNWQSGTLGSTGDSELLRHVAVLDGRVGDPTTINIDAVDIDDVVAEVVAAVVGRVGTHVGCVWGLIDLEVV